MVRCPQPPGSVLPPSIIEQVRSFATGGASLLIIGQCDVRKWH